MSRHVADTTQNAAVWATKSTRRHPTCGAKFIIIPVIVHYIMDKLHPEKLLGPDVVLRVNMIHYLTRIGYGMTKAPTVQIHPAITIIAIRPTIHSYIQRRRRTLCHKGLAKQIVNDERGVVKWVWISINNDSPPHRHRLQTRCFRVGLGFGDFYSIATVVCGKEAMGSWWQDNKSWEPKAKTFKPLASQSKDSSKLPL